ncbi:MAG: alpha/beta fold hydrolase [Chloroflexota bacterium]
MRSWNPRSLVVALSLGLLPGLAPAQGRVQLQYRHFDSAGVTIRYVDLGSGDPVFLLHGNGGSLENWVRNGFVQSLMPNFRVIAADARGNGQSGKPHQAKAYGLQLSLDVLRLMNHLGIAKADVVGYSMGAQTAAHLMVIAPKRLVAVVLGGAPGRYYWTEKDIREVDLHAAQRERDCVSRGMLNARRALGTAPISNAAFKRREAACFANKSQDRVALAALSRGQSTQLITRTQACAVSVPTLGVVGSLDGYLPYFRELESCRRNMQVVVIKGASHGSAFRSPEFFAATRAFLMAHRFTVAKR